MKTRVICFCACLCLSAEALAFTPAEARRVYGLAATNSPASTVMEADGFIFMEVKWSVGEDEETDECELSAVQDALEKYVATKIVSSNSPFAAALTDWLVPDVPYQLPNLQSVVVKKKVVAGVHYDVYAFESAPLKTARASAIQQQEKRLIKDRTAWGEALKAYTKTLKTENDRRQFCVMLGCPIVNLVRDAKTQNYGKPVKGCEAGVAELETFMSWKPEGSYFYSTHENVLWCNRAASEKSFFYPVFSADDGGAFARAKELAEKKDWEKEPQAILDELAKSIAAYPYVAEKWVCLGGALLKTGHPMEGLIAYIQGAKLDSENRDSWTGIMYCCDALKMKANASGLNWYLKVR